jgi:hypothetical protein
MPTRGKEPDPINDTLNPSEAAAHCGLLISTFIKLVKAKILPAPNAENGLWSPKALDSAIEVLLDEGISPDLVLPFTHHPLRYRVDGTKRRHAGWRHKDCSKLINHPVGSPLFCRAWLELERSYAKIADAPVPLSRVNSSLASPLRHTPDGAILKLIRALARQAAQEDHEREKAQDYEAGSDLRQVQHRLAERKIGGRSSRAVPRIRSAERSRRRGGL